MRKIARIILVTIAGGLILAIAAGVVGEFFIELARERGWYDSPSERLDAAVNAFSSFVTHPWFLALAAGFVGLAVGAWLDLFLRRRETAIPVAGPTPEPPMEEVVGRAFRQERVHLDYKTFIRCTFTNVTYVYNGSGPFDMDRCRHDGPITFASDVKEINNYIALLNKLGALRMGVEDPYGDVAPSAEIHFITHDGRELLPERDVDPNEHRFEGKRLRLLRSLPQVAHDKSFVRCELVGPANVVLWGFGINRTKCIQCDFFLVDKQKAPVNFMAFVNPTIEDCKLMGLTLFIPKEDKEKFESAFGGQPIPWINWCPAEDQS